MPKDWGDGAALRLIPPPSPPPPQATYGGELAAEAILDALTGAYSPAGRLPVTMYYPNVTARDARNYNLSDDGGITHQYFSGPVLRPFGYGLSYARFTYVWAGGATAAAVELGTGAVAAVELTLNVSNVGSVASDCVMLVFVSPPADGAAQLQRLDARRATDALPLQMLVGFERLRGLQPGETRVWSMRIDAEALAVTDGSGARVLVPGEYTLRVGGGGGDGGEEESAAVATVLVRGTSGGLIEVAPASAALRAMASGAA